MVCKRPFVLRIPPAKWVALTKLGRVTGTQGTIEVPCGRCRACRVRRSREWATRMLYEMDYHCKSTFATLTYDDEHLPVGGSLCKRDFCFIYEKVTKKYRT